MSASKKFDMRCQNFQVPIYIKKVNKEAVRSGEENLDLKSVPDANKSKQIVVTSIKQILYM